MVRSGNNPLADYCESLVARALKLDLLWGSNKGCDAVDLTTGTRYEIKGRRITRHNKSTQLSVIRDLDSCHFDNLIAVRCDEDFTVTHAFCVPREVVRHCATHRKHVNGWIMHLRPSLCEQQGVRDITQELKKLSSSGCRPSDAYQCCLAGVAALSRVQYHCRGAGTSLLRFQARPTISPQPRRSSG